MQRFTFNMIWFDGFNPVASPLLTDNTWFQHGSVHMGKMATEFGAGSKTFLDVTLTLSSFQIQLLVDG